MKVAVIGAISDYAERWREVGELDPGLRNIGQDVKCPALSQPMEREMTKSRKKFDAAFKAKIGTRPVKAAG